MKLLESRTIYTYSKVPGYVELWNGHDINANITSRKKDVATIATLAYGNDESTSPDKLYESLMKKKHYSVLEFIRDPLTYALSLILVMNKDVKKITIDDIKNILFPEGLIDMRNITGRNAILGKTFNQVLTELEEKKIELDLGDVSKLHRELWESYNFMFKIKVPIFVARQIQRHRSFSFLEVSRRYVTNEKKPFEFWQIGKVIDSDKYIKDYEKLLESDIEPETARTIMPLATYTEMWISGEIFGLINFFNLRLDDKTQNATKEVAEAMMELIVKNQPRLAAYFFLGQEQEDDDEGQEHADQSGEQDSESVSDS